MGPPPTRHGHSLGLATSAVIKEIRRGREEQALRWALELFDSGFVHHVWRRLLIAVCEDVGPAQPELVPIINGLHDVAVKLGRKEDKHQAARLPLVEAVILLSRAKKSRVCDHALIALSGEDEPPTVEPYHADKHTVEGRRQGASWAEFWAEGTLLANVENGELGYAPHVEDVYRDRAVKATGGRR
jgi:replication-associated recombination protein RarA